MPEFANADEKYKHYYEKTFAGPDGDPVVVTDVELTYDQKGQPQLVLAAEIASKLRDRNNPKAGADPVDPEAVSIILNVAGAGDKSKTFEAINNAFLLTGPDRLVDDGESYLRLAEDHDESIHHKVVGKKLNAYVAAAVSKKVDKHGAEYVPPPYFNLYAPRPRQKFTVAAVRQRQAEQEAALSA